MNVFTNIIFKYEIIPLLQKENFTKIFFLIILIILSKVGQEGEAHPASCRLIFFIPAALFHKNTGNQ